MDSISGFGEKVAKIEATKDICIYWVFQNTNWGPLHKISLLTLIDLYEEMWLERNCTESSKWGKEVAKL